MNVKKEDMKRLNEIIVLHKRYGSEEISVYHDPGECLDMIESILRNILKDKFVEPFLAIKASDIIEGKGEQEIEAGRLDEMIAKHKVDEMHI